MTAVVSLAPPAAAAHANANAIAGGPAPAGVAQYLTFMVGAHTFALPILAVNEIIRCSRVTKVPRAPAAIRGVINLRGAVLPVVDLAVRIGQPGSTPDAQGCVIVLQVQGSKGPVALGVMVDAVSAVLSFAETAIEPVPPFGVGLRPELLTGLVRADERFIGLLDTDRAFSVSELAHHGWRHADHAAAH